MSFNERQPDSIDVYSPVECFSRGGHRLMTGGFDPSS